MPCANGSTLTWLGTAVGEVRDLSFSETANEVDVTVLGDSQHTYCSGITDVECTIEILGSDSSNSIAIGATGAIALTWNDGGSESIGTAVCTARETSGALDGEISTNYTFKPSA